MHFEKLVQRHNIRRFSAAMGRKPQRCAEQWKKHKSASVMEERWCRVDERELENGGKQATEGMRDSESSSSASP
jgi:hypothetical protein